MHTGIKFFVCDICGQSFFGPKLPRDSDVVCPDCCHEYREQKEICNKVKAGDSNEEQY